MHFHSASSARAGPQAATRDVLPEAKTESNRPGSTAARAKVSSDAVAKRRFDRLARGAATLESVQLDVVHG